MWRFVKNVYNFFVELMEVTNVFLEELNNELSDMNEKIRSNMDEETRRKFDEFWNE